MNTIKILIMAGFALAITACASGGGEQPAQEKPAAAAVDTAAFDAALADAKAEYARADESGFAWRDTEELFKSAEKAIKEGDAEKAMKLVKMAKQQSTSALEQAAQQKDAAPRY